MYKQQLLSDCERRLPVPMFSMWQESNISCLCSFTLKPAKDTRTHVKLLSRVPRDKTVTMTEGSSKASEGKMNVVAVPDSWCQIVVWF